jgi:pyridoxine 5-phosphate synthase
MIRLFVNVDHVATIRQARRGTEPDPLDAALLAESAGADGITVHLREDRRHIQDHDVERLRNSIRTPLNFEMAAVEEMVQIAIRLCPHQVSLVPEKRQEITTEGGLDVRGQAAHLQRLGERFKPLGIRFSLFVDAEREQIDAAHQVGADSVEINTGKYTEECSAQGAERQLTKIRQAAAHSASLGLRVFAGHGLTSHNVIAIAGLPQIEELNIGHHIVSRSVLVGFEEAVREMMAAIRRGEKGRIG